MKNLIEKLYLRISKLDSKRILFLIFIVATIIRILYISFIPNGGIVGEHVNLTSGLASPIGPFDPTEYDRMALSILSGEGFKCLMPKPIADSYGWSSRKQGIRILWTNWYGLPSALRQPGYPVFLAGMHLLFDGKGYLIAVRIFECIVGGLTCVVAYMIGRNCFNKFVGITSAIVYAFYPFTIIQPGSFMVETILLFLISLAILFLVKASAKWKYRYFILSGLFIGLSTLFKSPMQLFPLFVLFWLLLYGKKDLKKRMIGFLLLTLVFACVISPWVIRNRIVLGKATIVTGHGALLWTFNNPTVKVVFHQQDKSGGDIVLESLKKDSIDIKSVVAVDEYCIRKFKEFVRSDTKKFILLTFGRFVAFWKIYSSNVSIWLNIGSIFTYGILFLCMLLGIMFLFVNKNTKGMLLILIMLYYSMANSLIMTHMRYRYTVEIYIIIIAVYGIYEIMNKRGMLLKSSNS